VAQPSPVAANAFADVGSLLSKVNHRLYRQSRYYECSVTIDSNVADGTTVDVYALADTWWTQKSLQLAKQAWDESNAEEKMMLNGKVARWNDFRVQAGLGGFGGLNPVQFSRVTLANVPFLTGEFEDSSVVDQAGVTRVFTWGVGSANSYSLMDEYNATGNTSADPQNPATGAYTGLLPNLEAGAAAALQDDGNQPPYDANNYGSGYWVKVGTLHLAGGRQRLSTGYFTAPCGLIALTNVGFLANPDIQVEIKAGDYKGVKAPSILE
jgi:hypothetical protein